MTWLCVQFSDRLFQGVPLISCSAFLVLIDTQLDYLAIAVHELASMVGATH